MSQTKIIYMFRHGETAWNREGRMQGGTDIPLNKNGRAQAFQLREFFSRNPVDVFLSSDLGRARETAAIVAGDTGTAIVLDRRLRETNLGAAEGLTAEEFIARFGPEALESWRSLDHGDAHVRFPEGESKFEHLTRFKGGLLDLLHSAEASSWTRIGVSTHGGSMRRLLHHLRPDLMQAIMVGNCTAYRLEYHLGSGEWAVDLTPVFSAE